jgi:predicted ferric reductase
MALRIKKILLIVLYFLFPVTLIYLYFSGNWYAITDSWSIAMVAGLIAGAILLNQFILSARIKFLDRIYGLDKILKFHGHIMILADMLIIIHLVLKLQFLFEYNLQVILGFTALGIFFTVVFITVLLMVKTYTEPFSLFRKIRDFFIRKTGIQYQSLRFFHNFTFFALIALTVHIVLASSTQENNLRIYFIIAWSSIVTLIYLKNLIIKPAVLRKNAFTVNDVIKENDNITTIKIDVPEKSGFSYKAGQFAYFKFLNKIPGKEEHPVSFSCPPGKTVSITVKNLGDWTGKLNEVKPGDKVAVDGPYGIFTYTRIKPDRGVCFIAGGIGITPFLCMLRDIKSKRIILKNIKLIWQVSTKKDLIYLDEIKNYEKEIENFEFFPVVSSDDAWNGISGRIDKEKLKKMHLVKKAEYFICVPNKMLKFTIKLLKKLGIKKRFIHYENFNM